jgi:hypothetical protein
LKDNGAAFYIDDALANGLTFRELEDKLLYQQVIIQYPERWMPVKNDQAKFYISQLEHDGEVIFKEKD